MKLYKKIKVGVDSPSAAGAGTISKMVAKHYNLLYCDTGKIYRFLAIRLMQKKQKTLVQVVRFLRVMQLVMMVITGNALILDKLNGTVQKIIILQLMLQGERLLKTQKLPPKNALKLSDKLELPLTLILEKHLILMKHINDFNNRNNRAINIQALDLNLVIGQKDGLLLT